MADKTIKTSTWIIKNNFNIGVLIEKYIQPYTLAKTSKGLSFFQNECTLPPTTSTVYTGSDIFGKGETE